MKSLHHRAGVCAGALLLLFLSAGAFAAPVTFSGTASGFTPGTGYGVEGGEVIPTGLPGAGNPLPGGQGGTLLDVLFSGSGASVTFTLPGLGSSLSGVFGTVQLRERFIDAAETDNLGVTADITITLPIAGLLSVTATGTAIVGAVGTTPPLGEAGGVVDLTIDWAPLDVSFGDGGLFRIEMADLSFTGLTNPLNSQTLDQAATVTLLAEPKVVVVPEPGVLALFGLGFAGLGFSLRQMRRVISTWNRRKSTSALAFCACSWPRSQ